MPRSPLDRRRPLGRRRFRRRRAAAARRGPYRAVPAHENWEDDGYCDNAREFQDARRVCLELGLPLHRVNFAREYREQVFADFLAEYRKGRTPNPDVLCNRQIKFGVMRRYAQRLGATQIATGHYARVDTVDGVPQLSQGRRRRQGPELLPARRRRRRPRRRADAARRAHEERGARDRARSRARRSPRRRTAPGICFIGERPFAEFLHHYLPDDPGVIRDDSGIERGRHRGLAYYTLGQRHGLHIGGAADRPEDAWYVAAKDAARNELIVVQGHEHPLLARAARSSRPACTGSARRRASGSGASRCAATRRFATASPTRPAPSSARAQSVARSAVRRTAAHADAGAVRRPLRRRPLLGRRDDRSRPTAASPALRAAG